MLVKGFLSCPWLVLELVPVLVLEWVLFPQGVGCPAGHRLENSWWLPWDQDILHLFWNSCEEKLLPMCVSASEISTWHLKTVA